MDDKNNYTIYTDGSGHEDGFGGFGAAIEHPATRFRASVMGGQSGTSTARMEFQAVLSALHAVRLHNLSQGDAGRPHVTIVTDRQDMAESINMINERKANQDLWASLGYFEQTMTLEAQHEKRNTVPQQAECDAMAAVGRELIKNYLSEL